MIILNKRYIKPYFYNNITLFCILFLFNYNNLKYRIFRFDKLYLTFEKNNPVTFSVSLDSANSYHILLLFIIPVDYLFKGLQFGLMRKTTWCIFSGKSRTNKYGKCYFTYIPPDSTSPKSAKSQVAKLIAKK